MKAKDNPIVLANTEWMPPDWLMEEVKAERMVISLCALAKPDKFKNDSDYVGEVECLAYIMPATGRAPLDSDATQIYLYLASRVMKRIKKVEVPKDIKVEKLTDYQEHLLESLKNWIFQKRNGKVRNPVVEALTEAFSPDPKQLTLKLEVRNGRTHS